MPKGVKITTDKQVTDVDCNNLADYQAVVGGLIEPLPLPRFGGDVILNEEGKLIGLPFNSIATDVALLSGGLDPRDVIVGDVVVMGPVDGRGEMTDVTDKARRAIARVAREA